MPRFLTEEDIETLSDRLRNSDLVDGHGAPTTSVRTARAALGGIEFSVGIPGGEMAVYMSGTGELRDVLVERHVLDEYSEERFADTVRCLISEAQDCLVAALSRLKVEPAS